jgi:competence protein ComEC
MAGLACGLALAESGAVVALAIAVALGAALAALREPQLGAIAATLLLAGAAAGAVRLDTLDAPAQRVRDGARVALRAEVLTPPRPNAFGSSAEARVTSGRLRGARLLVRAARWAPMPRRLEVGDELQLQGRLATLSPSGGAGFDFAEHLRRRGVAGELLVDSARATGTRRGGLAGVLDRMRERAEHAVGAGMPADKAALLRGMVLGQDELVAEATRQDWRDSGLAHLLAVSGQNVMLLAALALPLLALARFGRGARLVALAALIAVYVPLAGAGPSLQRAGVMGLAGLAAMAASRPASRWYALLLAAAATLAWNPRAWADPGWQLSFAAVGGILTIGAPLQRTLRRAATEVGGEPRREAAGHGPAAEVGGEPGGAAAEHRARRLRSALARGLADGVAITFSATLATAPLLAHHFGSVPLAGLPANLLALPAVAPAMWLGMLKTALGQLGASGVPPPLDALGSSAAGALGGLATVPVGYLIGLAERFADMPGGRLAVPLRSPAAVLGAYAAMLAAAVALRGLVARPSDRALQLAARWRVLRRGPRRAVAAALCTALAGAALALTAGPGPPDRVTVRFLDVGQGDATLIQDPGGAAVLFDGGPPEAGIARLLRRAGVERLAVVVATHASRDHHGGLGEVLRRFPVDLLLDGGDGSADPSFRALLREAARRGVRRVSATAPLSLAFGALRVRVLSPAPRAPGPAPEDPNPRAVVALVSAGAFDLLLSADAESEALLPLDLPDVDAIKVPHHGSSDPGLPEVLDRLDPALAAIEVGPNTYGHPAPTTLAALERARVRTFRTDRDGTVTVALEGEEMRVETER